MVVTSIDLRQSLLTNISHYSIEQTRIASYSLFVCLPVFQKSKDDRKTTLD